MLEPLGHVIAASDVPASAWALGIPAERRPLVLAPASEGGWFGGRSVIAWDAEVADAGGTLREAGDALQQAFDADEPCLTAAVITYEGDVTVLRYTRGAVLTQDGWHTWGDAAAAPLPTPTFAVPTPGPLVADAVAEMDAAAYQAAVERVRDRVRDGDVYVLNLTYHVRGTATRSAPETFAALVRDSAGDHSAYVGAPQYALASVSPERFLRVRRAGTARSVEVWPMKGTRPRGTDAADDAAQAAALAADTKERAEHVMVVDLERNDLGRVCAPGSVSADPLFEIVQTPYCHQMISRVCGQLRVEAGFGDLLEAAFPCGSVTGAPKLAAIRIARELERSPRGAYCGTLAVAVPGELDSSILIRTAELADGRLSWGTGCGITHDSDPAAEWRESELKASPLWGPTSA